MTISSPTSVDLPEDARSALSDPALAGITRLAAIDTVRARMALAVELGLLLPGDRVPAVREVAEALAVSQITARRALESLAEDGVLVRRRGRGGGTYVADVPIRSAIDEVRSYLADASEVHNLIDRRLLIECTLAHHAALAATPTQLSAMDGEIQSMREAPTWAEYHAADTRFHLAVATASGLDFALPHYQRALSELYRYFLPYPIAFLHEVNDEHAELVSAIRANDPVAAVRVTRAHVDALHRSMFVGFGYAPGE